MALRRPIVLGTTGRKELLQSTDTIFLGATNVHGIEFTNTSGSSIAAGTPVYLLNNSVYLADQGAGEPASWVQGLVTSAVGSGSGGVIQMSGVLTLTTGEWDALVGTTGGLTPNSKLWLHLTLAGKLTPVLPPMLTTVNKYLLGVGRAVNATAFEISIASRVLL